MAERLPIDAILKRGEGKVVRGRGICLLPASDHFRYVFDAAIWPAMKKAGVEGRSIEICFDSDSGLAEVVGAIASAEVIVAELSTLNADVMYVLGLCHGIGRWPILIMHRGAEPPFGMGEMGRIEYETGPRGMHELRENLKRAVRRVLAMGRGEAK